MSYTEALRCTGMAGNHSIKIGGEAMKDAEFDELMQRAGSVPRVRAEYLIQLIQEAKAEARNAAGEGGGDSRRPPPDRWSDDRRASPVTAPGAPHDQGS